VTDDVDREGFGPPAGPPTAHGTWRSAGPRPVGEPRRDGDPVGSRPALSGWESPHRPLALPDPPAPRPQATTFPTIPQRRPLPPPQQPDRRPRVTAIAMVAALLGAIMGTGGSLLFLDGRVAAPGVPQASPVATGEVVAPTIEVAGEDLDGVDRVAAVAEAVLPTVVQINIRGGDGPLGGLTAGNGSGVVYRSDGHIITNNHVVAGGGELEVLFTDGDRQPAEVVGTDPETDLAVVKVGRTGLTAIQVGDSTQLRVGELAVAVGSPFGLEGTVTSGVISSLNRQIRVGGPDGAPLTLPNVIQTDAPINPGNSGGALVNGSGELIGINSAILTQGGTAANAGVGFAIPASIAIEIADQLIERGFVQHPFLGIAGTDVSREIAERLGVQDGAYVEQVVPDTPAAGAGLREGDVITEVAGEPVASMQDLIAAILRQQVGDVIEITYIRGGQETSAEVTLAEKPRG
jgi:putative serine protease PepD